MNPDIVEKEVCIVVGIRSVWDLNPELPGSVWREKVAPRLDELPTMRGNAKAAFIVFAPIPDDEQGRYEIVAGRLSDSLEAIPVGMVGWEVPPGVFAVVKSKGVKEIVPTYRQTIDRWLPGTGYEPGNGLVVAHTISGDVVDDPDTVWQVSIQLRNPADIGPFGIWE